MIDLAANLYVPGGKKADKAGNWCSLSFVSGHLFVRFGCPYLLKIMSQSV